MTHSSGISGYQKHYWYHSLSECLIVNPISETEANWIKNIIYDHKCKIKCSELSVTVVDKYVKIV